MIKVLSGVHQLTEGEIKIDGEKVNFSSPKDSSEAGIGTVYQDLALNALTSVTRNFFLGREIVKGFVPLGFMDFKKMNEITTNEKTFSPSINGMTLSFGITLLFSS